MRGAALAFLLAGLAAAAPPAVPPLDPAIDGATIVERRVVADGVITELYGGRIDGRPAWVWDATWNPCRHPQPAEVAQMRYLSAAQVAKLRAASDELDRDDVAALPGVPCGEAAKAERFFTFAVFETPPLVPNMWSLVENSRDDQRGDGGPARMLVYAVQVAGSMGGVVTTTEIVQPSEGAPRTLWQSVVKVRLGMPVPDSILDRVIPKSDAPPRRLLLEKLRARASAEAR